MFANGFNPCLFKWTPSAFPTAWPIVPKGVYIPWFIPILSLKKFPIADPSDCSVLAVSVAWTLYPTEEFTLVKESTFCFAINKGPLGDLKSINIWVNLDTSLSIILGSNVPPLNKKSGPPVLPTSDRSSGIDLVT